MGWIIFTSFYSEILISYIIIYTLISLLLFTIFNKLNILILFNQINSKNKIILLFNLLSLAGIPPLLGFLLKWIVLFLNQQLLKSISISLIIIILTNFLFYAYIRMAYFSLININKFTHDQKINQSLYQTSITINSSIIFLIHTFLK